MTAAHNFGLAVLVSAEFFLADIHFTTAESTGTGLRQYLYYNLHKLNKFVFNPYFEMHMVCKNKNNHK